MPEPSPITVFPFHHLMKMLRMNGFILGVDSYIRMAEYWQLALHDELLNPFELKAQMGALFCRSEAQQQRFERLFDSFLPPNLKPLDDWQDWPSPPRLEDSSSTTPDLPQNEPRPTSPNQANQTPQIPVGNERLGPVLPLLNFPESRLRVWNLAGMGQAMPSLQEKVWTETLEWDLPQTMKSMIRSGGYPRFVFKKRKQAPRYLVLIEQQSPRDHLAGFAAELVKEINRRDLEVDFYFFDKNPAHCWKVQRDPLTHQSLELLKSEWSGARLLLLGHASRFIHPETGAPSNLALDLPDDFSHIAFLATNSPVEWGAAERSLSSLMSVLPMGVEGLGKLMDSWNGNPVPSFADWQAAVPEPAPPLVSDGFKQRNPTELFMELYRYLGKDAFRWLCACAVYPEIYFELTCILHDEAIPVAEDLSEWQQNEAWNHALRLLSRLEWFRRGYLPESLTDDLKNYLSATDRAMVEGEIRRILEISKNQVGQQTYAAEERHAMFEWLAGQSFRVLWVDDHPENNERFIASWSKSLGIVFRAVTSTAQATQLLANERFDLIISDLGRKGKEKAGESILKLANGQIPVVFFTNKNGMNLRGSLISSGALEVTNSIGRLREVLTDGVKGIFTPAQQEASFAGYEASSMVQENMVEQPKPKAVRKEKATKSKPILEAQTLLTKLGLYNGAINGLSDEKTKAAIIAFQKSNGLFADGLVGPQTKAALEKAVETLEKYISTPPPKSKAATKKAPPAKIQKKK